MGDGGENFEENILKHDFKNLNNDAMTMSPQVGGKSSSSFPSPDDSVDTLLYKHKEDFGRVFSRKSLLTVQSGFLDGIFWEITQMSGCSISIFSSG